MTDSIRARLPFRLALATVLSMVPLVLFGGSVTTLEAGMAVEGWLVAEGHFLLFFPVEKWFRDPATIVEHTHRLFGALVGALAIATVIGALLRDPRRRARVLTVIGLVAICVQGTLGGLRVLEDSPRLAFLHGALAQAVLALWIGITVYLSPAWSRWQRATDPAPERLRRLATLCTGAVYGQVVVGAWYRHALRDPATPHGGRFMLHLVAAFVLIGLLATLAVRLRELGTPGALRASRLLVRLLGLQVVAGLLALMGFRPGSVGPLELGASILHVLGGGLLLGSVLAVRLWASRGRRASDGRPAPPLFGAATEGVAS